MSVSLPVAALADRPPDRYVDAGARRPGEPHVIGLAPEPRGARPGRMRMRLDDVAPVLYFLIRQRHSIRLLPLIAAVDGVDIPGLHNASSNGDASRCYWFGFPTAPLDRDAATSFLWFPFLGCFSYGFHILLVIARRPAVPAALRPSRWLTPVPGCR